MVIYIHIPFCVKKCDYCDFLSAPVDEYTRQNYVKCIIKELMHYGEIYGGNGRNIPVTSVFFGGGTPSLLDELQITSIMKAVNDNYNIVEEAEITMECNPGTLTESKLSGYKKAGINRLSIGLQSANDEELRNIGRIHTFAQFMDSYNMARKCGFDNINIDLMSALPGQTISSYKDTIEKVLAVKPEHISAYSLILEEGTPLFERIEKLEDEKQPTGLPDEDTEREMYYMTERLLKDAGYSRYEISNYALSGYECKHNTAYWVRDNYLGVGIGAASCMDNVRTKNITDIQEYMDIYGDNEKYHNQNLNTKSADKDVETGKGEEAVESINKSVVECVIDNSIESAIDREETVTLTREDMMAEFMFLGLRMMKGISKKQFEQEFGVAYNDIYGEVTDKLIKEGLIKEEIVEEIIEEEIIEGCLIKEDSIKGNFKDNYIDNDRICLTSLGIDVSNMVLSQFIF